MKGPAITKFRFSELRRDRWLELAGRLNSSEISELRFRSSAHRIYRIARATLLAPIILSRGMLALVILAGELEVLHFRERRKIKKIGEGCVIDCQTWIIGGDSIQLGNFVKVSCYGSLMAGRAAKISIGDNTIIGPGANIIAFNHNVQDPDIPIRYQGNDDRPEHSICMGQDVWVGAHVLILPGVSIGDGAIIAAGTTLTQNVPERTVAYMKDGVLKFRPRKVRT